MVTIRRATQADREGLLEIARLYPGESRIHLAESDGDAADTKGNRLLADRSWCVLVAFDDELGNVVGYALGCDWERFLRRPSSADVSSIESRRAEKPEVELEELIVLPEQQGKGVGTLLVRAFEDWARDAGFKVCTLGGGPAPGFYEKLGYHREAPLFRFTKNL
jgi:GNAT superfamily N-acetyltransferase